MRHVLAVFILAAALMACGQPDAGTVETETEAKAVATAPAQETVAPAAPAGVQSLEIVELLAGNADGTEAVSGKMVQVHYTGWLYDPTQPDNKGKKFDSSLDRGSPFGFVLGQGKVIRGWDEGVAGMRVGEQRRLIIPYAMAYGARGYPPVIPPAAPLVFDVELLGVDQ